MDPKRTREALDHFEVASPETLDGQPGVFIAPLNLDESVEVFEAVCEWVDLFEECENPECERGMVHDGFDGLHNKQVECPSCKGRGFSLNQERFDAAWPKAMAKIGAFLHPRLVAAGNPIDITSGEMGELAKAAAEAAILAFLLEGPNGD